MIQGLIVRELPSHLGEKGYRIDIWEGGEASGSHLASSCHAAFPGVVEAWTRRDRASERIICLDGMIKLVLCDRRGGSPSEDEVNELFLGEYRYREVIVPPGVLRGWKVLGNRPALVLLALEGEDGGGTLLTQEEAGVPYDWEIVMK